MLFDVLSCEDPCIIRFMWQVEMNWDEVLFNLKYRVEHCFHKSN
ncbi:hypothetical protein DP49_5316 [Burkholderia pseudomallei]|nr:hypothetical protein DP49_5316 [Burkholderia pseudomallei]